MSIWPTHTCYFAHPFPSLVHLRSRHRESIIELVFVQLGVKSPSSFPCDSDHRPRRVLFPRVRTIWSSSFYSSFGATVLALSLEYCLSLNSYSATLIISLFLHKVSRGAALQDRFYFTGILTLSGALVQSLVVSSPLSGQASPFSVHLISLSAGTTWGTLTTLTRIHARH